jgi:hypothetical protein
MASQRYWVDTPIYCVLTSRDVTIQREVVEIRAMGAGGVAWGRRRCDSVNLSICPGDCIYISGGKGFGTDPTTGERVNTP